MKNGIAALAGLSAVALATQAMGNVSFTNFSEYENVENNEVSVLDGSFWAGLGVLFSTGQVSGSVATGQILNWTTISPLVTVYSNDDAVSGQNFVGAYDKNRLDSVMMQFDAENVNFVSLHTDLAVEGGDIVRLIALRELGNGDFLVLDWMEILDNGTTLEDSYMEVFTGGEYMTHAVFQITTEREGFDNLSFGFVVPSPGASILALGGLAALTRRRR